MASRRPAILLGALVLSFSLISLAWAAEFSAAVVNKIANHEMQGKIYVKGEKARLESSTPLGPVISILRLDKNAMWMLMPGQKTYMEMPFDKEAYAKALNIPALEASQKLPGTETINGYDTERYETTVKTDGQEMKSTMWVSKNLGVPLKIETADKSFVQEYKDIREGGVDDALFELPAGYKKMTMPAGLPKMK
jgi:outer membrane lipoprotein-sorting protein